MTIGNVIMTSQSIELQHRLIYQVNVINIYYMSIIDNDQVTQVLYKLTSQYHHYLNLRH
jgi:hypothetical protein